jgi:hypothetical protein
MKIAPLLLVTLAAATQAAAQEAQPLGHPVGGAAVCGARLMQGSSVDWSTDTPIIGDFNLDGVEDAAAWGTLEGDLVVRVGRCAGEELVEQWLFPIDLADRCEPSLATVRPGSLMLGEAIVERVCSRGEGRDECVHLRRENERRRMLDAAGGREIRVEVPGCAAVALVWSPQLGGFMTIPR